MARPRRYRKSLERSGGKPVPIRALDADRCGYPKRRFGIVRAERDRPANRIVSEVSSSHVDRDPVSHFMDAPVPMFEFDRFRSGCAGSQRARRDKPFPHPPGGIADRRHDARRSPRLTAAAFIVRRRAHRHVNPDKSPVPKPPGNARNYASEGIVLPPARFFGHDLEGLAAYGALLIHGRSRPSHIVQARAFGRRANSRMARSLPSAALEEAAAA